MNKNVDINDEQVASDSEVNAMNKEYSLKLNPNNMLRFATMNKLVKCKKPNICTLNFDSIARAYFLERDILISLQFLYQKSRMQYTRNTIKNIMKIKESSVAKLLSLYIKGTGHTLSYAPNIIDRPTYNALYNEINYMQCELLNRLSDIHGICEIIYKEHSATLMLHSIRP